MGRSAFASASACVVEAGSCAQAGAASGREQRDSRHALKRMQAVLR